MLRGFGRVPNHASTTVAVYYDVTGFMDFFLPAADDDAMSTSVFSFSNVYRIPLTNSLQRRRPAAKNPNSAGTAPRFAMATPRRGSYGNIVPPYLYRLPQFFGN